MTEVVIKVLGMSCGGCVKNVTAVLTAMPGVTDAEVSLENGEAKVSYDSSITTLGAMRDAIEAAGFDAPQ